MPRFTPDVRRWPKLGRPWKMWFTSAWWEAFTIAFDGQDWHIEYSPTDEWKAQFPYVFDTGRDHHVTYQEVRDMKLTEIGAVHYVNDFEDEWDDFFISRENKPFDRATHPEPVR